MWTLRHRNPKPQAGEEGEKRPSQLSHAGRHGAGVTPPLLTSLAWKFDSEISQTLQGLSIPFLSRSVGREEGRREREEERTEERKRRGERNRRRS